MSILQDLDPKYAKIHAQPSIAWKPAIWVGALLFTLGCGYWGATKTQTKAHSFGELPVAPISAENQQESATPKSVAMTKQEKPETTPPPLSGNLSATIREGAPTGTADQRITSPTPAAASENTSGSLADTEYRRQTPSTSGQTNMMPSTKAPLAHGARKTERKSATAQSTAKSEKPPIPSGKRTNERDVDIITAIVR